MEQHLELVLMAYSMKRDRDQEDHGSKPVWGNSSEKAFTKKGLVAWLEL
jgi:hypothetical protein